MEERDLRNIPVLSVIIPAYNEEKTIGSTIKVVKKILNSFSISYEIIIIIDGSTDRTKEEAEKFKTKMISLRRNMGKGHALRIGFDSASGKNLLTIDADGAHRKDDIRNLIEIYFERKAHMFIGSRFKNSRNSRFTSSMNLIGNKLIKYFFYLISGNYITDSLSGLRIFDRMVLDSTNCKSQGYEIDGELTAETIGMGFNVKEIPIKCAPRIYGSSHLNSIIDGIRITKTIVNAYYLGRKRSRLTD